MKKNKSRRTADEGPAPRPDLSGETLDHRTLGEDPFPNAARLDATEKVEIDLDRPKTGPVRWKPDPGIFGRTTRKILEFLFPRLLARRLRAEWNTAVAAEVLTDDPEKAKFVVYQVDGKVRLVADRLFARHGDLAVATKSISEADVAGLAKNLRRPT